MRHKTLLSLTVFCGALILGCKKEQLPYKSDTSLQLPDVPFNYSKPQLSDPSKTFTAQLKLQQQQVTDHGATLGRVLFYDPILSRTNTVSCASCHQQAFGFADTEQFSKGFDGKRTTRNAPGIANLYNYDAFFWDGRETDLKKMAISPIANHIEMGLDESDVLVKKIKSAAYYKPLFEQAFGNGEVNEQKIGSALAQFLNAIITESSPADQLNGGGWSEPTNLNQVFTDPKIQLGGQIFFGKGLCSNCHSTSLTNSFASATAFANIGLDINSTDPGATFGNSNLSQLFKIPDLHNVALTAPYMHDGRFKTLREVIDHYSDNIQPSASLSWQLRTGDDPIRLNFTDAEKDALVAFLHQFTDASIAKDTKFSNPFR